MTCVFEYCIYNKNSRCIVTDVEINAFGMCNTCIMVSFNKEFLEKEKEQQLLKTENLWAEKTN